MVKYFPNWTEKRNGVIAPDERLPIAQTAMMGVQHVIAMFGATVLGPLLMGFDPNVAILMSGIGTLLFFVLYVTEMESASKSFKSWRTWNKLSSPTCVLGGNTS